MGYIIVTGERGALMASFSRGGGESLRRLDPGSDEWKSLPLPQEASGGQPHAVPRMMGSFVDSIIRGRVGDMDATFEDGYRSQATIDAIMRASASRSWERVATGLDESSG
jgi:predicted dehydrogenase